MTTPTTEEIRLTLMESDPDKALWRTKDERLIPVNKMEDEHLKNTIAFMRRSFERNPVLQNVAFECSVIEIKALDGPLGPQGEMSYEVASNELVEREPIDGLPIFRALVAEQKRRGLH